MSSRIIGLLLIALVGIITQLVEIIIHIPERLGIRARIGLTRGHIGIGNIAKQGVSLFFLILYQRFMSEESKISTITRIPAIVAILILGISFLNWPIGFYTVLRIIVAGSAIYYAYKISTKTDYDHWFWLFVVVAIIFNPLVPVHIGDKSVWQVIDWLVIGYFALFVTAKLPKLSN